MPTKERIYHILVVIQQTCRSR